MKSRIKFSSLLILTFYLLVLFACSSDDESAVISISLGMTIAPGKATVNIDQLVHVITFTGPSEKQVFTVSGAGNVKATVAPGLWTIYVEAYLDNKLYAVGSSTADVKAGRTTDVTIKMNVVWTDTPNKQPQWPSTPSTPEEQPEEPTDSGITVAVSPSAVSIEIGQSQTFTALVDGSPSPIQTVSWYLYGNTSEATEIDTSGRLQVAMSEPIGAVLTITAVSVADPTKSGMAIITVSNLPTLTGSVSISGDDWENATLTAAYSGTGAGVEAVQWRRNGSEIPGAIGATYVVADADRGQDITAAVQYSGNSSLVESSSYPIRNLTGIYDQAQLAAIGTDAVTLGKYYILVASSIALTGNWMPIGNDTTSFTGSFDGQNNTISGLTINTTVGYQGLFGYVNGGTVKNLGLTGVDIINGGNGTGGVVGYSNNGIIENCSVDGSITGSGERIGGAVGYTDNSTIQNCYTICNINSSGILVGGVVGRIDNGSIIKNCYAKGTIISTGVGTGVDAGAGWIGGVVGAAIDSTIQNCYATGNVTGYGSRVGGLVGSNNNSTMQNCYAIGNVTGYSCYVGGLAGLNPVDGDSRIMDCVALNTTITRAGGSEPSYGRVVGINDALSPAALSNNYANIGMSPGGTLVTFAGTNAANDLGGADVNYTPVGTPTPPDAAEETWWSGGVFASVWGTSDSAPWQWNSTDMRPKLYFE